MSMIERLLMRVRPQELQNFLKRIYGAKRRTVKTSDGYRLWIDPISFFGQELLNSNTYEIELTEVIKKMLRPGDTFVDAGANEGYFSVIASSIVGNGKVIAFEPQSRLIPIIKENFKLNQCTSVELNQIGLSDKEGSATLFLANDINSGASSMIARARSGKKETIRLAKLDDVVKLSGTERVRLLKIDCEGLECAIIRGAENLLKRRQIEFVSVDYHTHIISAEEAYATDRQLRESGYRLTQVANGQWLYHLPELEGDLKALGPLKTISSLDETSTPVRTASST